MKWTCTRCVLVKVFLMRTKIVKNIPLKNGKCFLFIYILSLYVKFGYYYYTFCGVAMSGQKCYNARMSKEASRF